MKSSVTWLNSAKNWPTRLELGEVFDHAYLWERFKMRLLRLFVKIGGDTVECWPPNGKKKVRAYRRPKNGDSQAEQANSMPRLATPSGSASLLFKARKFAFLLVPESLLLKSASRFSIHLDLPATNLRRAGRVWNFYGLIWAVWNGRGPRDRSGDEDRTRNRHAHNTARCAY